MSDLQEKIKLKRFLNKLKDFAGKHTEFITVYIPPNTEIVATIQQLEFEQGTATNIKDKSNSKAVIQALERMIRTLRTFEYKTGTNGLAIFSGNISKKVNVDNYEIFYIIPPEPINLKLYRCDKRFVLDPLVDICDHDEVYGLIVMDKGDATIGVLKGSSIKVVKKITSNVPGKHKTGGQSAQRFERIREGAAVEFYKRISDIVIKKFTFMKELKGILIGGPGTSKNNFFDGNYMNKQIKDKVITIKDITYTNTFGLKELLDKSQDILKESGIQIERKHIDEFLTQLGVDTTKAVYGFDDVIHALSISAVKKLIVVESSVDEKQLNDLIDLCDDTKAEIILVSDLTPEGKQLKGLTGVGGILRFPIG